MVDPLGALDRRSDVAMSDQPVVDDEFDGLASVGSDLISEGVNASSVLDGQRHSERFGAGVQIRHARNLGAKPLRRKQAVITLWKSTYAPEA